VHETLDGGRSWKTLIKGMDVVEGFGFDPAKPTFHDPHCMRLCATNPDRLYQQNHCGIYRLDRPSDTWLRIGRSMPKTVGDIGFPLVLHPRNDNVAWVFPMDGSDVWPRTSPGGRPSVYRTRDAGQSWQRCDAGLPHDRAWWTVLRQSMTTDHHDPLGLYFGTTTGQVWGSRDEGDTWRPIVEHLPHVYSVELARNHS